MKTRAWPVSIYSGVVVVALALGCAAEPTPNVKSERRGLPFAVDKLSEAQDRHFSGTVSEVRQVSGYTYVAVALEGGELRWTASLKKDVDVGAAVSVRAFGKATDFHSKKLGTTFSQLWFGIVTPS